MKELSENMNKDCGIYAIIVNEWKMYIGSSKNLKERREEHFSYLRKNKHDNDHLQKAFNKYGEQAFKWEILKYCKEDQRIEKEQFYINKYNTFNRDCGYNIRKPDLTVMAEETKQKISITKTGTKLSEEHKVNISKGLTGKTLSESHRRKISIANKGVSRNLTKEQRKKLKGRTPWNKGILQTEETKRKMSISHSGKPHPWKRKEIIFINEE
jgi:group I intron endonuclease